ncbi:MAG: type IV pilin [Bacteroidota bacterium]|jgi:hypothetical protein
MKIGFIKKERGISEVVGIILLISIGIVLVAVVSMYVSGFFSSLTSGSSNVSLTANVLPDVKNNQITFLISSGSCPSPFFLGLLTPSGQNVLSNPGVTLVGSSTVTVYGQNVAVKLLDVDRNGKLDAGDVIVLSFSGQGISAFNGYVFQIMYSNAVVYSYTIQV